jgi:BirA family biotin operon repressor/biotin-[acetyl-CoA-carboxylase] ligase
MSFTENILTYETLDSTNEEAKRLFLDRKLSGPTTVVADVQDAGRGRYEREWISPKGNLYASIIFVPPKSLPSWPEVAFIASLAVREVIAEQVSASVECKWPNDVLVDGKKCAGILLEAVTPNGLKPEALVVGIGVNVENFPENVSYAATSLKAQGAEIDKDTILKSLLGNLEKRLQRWQEAGFEVLRREWLSHACFHNEKIEVRLPEETMVGIFKDIDLNGSLVLETETGTLPVRAGDVFLIDS